MKIGGKITTVLKQLIITAFREVNLTVTQFTNNTKVKKKNQ